MSRETLRTREGQILRVRCYIDRYGRNSCTYLLTQVVDAQTGAALTDHLWTEIGPWAEGLRPGDTIEFDAEIVPYLKGHVGQRPPIDALPSIDWTIGAPTNLCVVAFGPTHRMMADGSIRPLIAGGKPHKPPAR